MTFGAVSNAALQLAASGRINFGQLLQSALSAGATAGIAHLPGVGQHLTGTAAQRLIGIHRPRQRARRAASRHGRQLP